MLLLSPNGKYGRRRAYVPRDYQYDSEAKLALNLDVPPNRINQIISVKRNISADTALRRGRYFGTTPVFWMSLQKTCELDLARADVGGEIKSLQQRERSLDITNGDQNKTGPFPQRLPQGDICFHGKRMDQLETSRRFRS